MANHNLNEHRRDWEDLASLDPMWAVLSRKGMEGGRWQADEFYATGRMQVGRDLRCYKALGLPQHFCRTLDFGCGLGRLTYAWAEHSDEAIGLDISKEMVRAAAEAQRTDNARFAHNDRPDLSLYGDGEFDHVTTDIVLQHIPQRPVIIGYLKEFLRVTAPGGVIRFQLPSRLPISLRFKFRRPIYRALRTAGAPAKLLYSWSLNPMKMNEVPVERVIKLFNGKAALFALLQPDSKFTTYIYRKLPL